MADCFLVVIHPPAGDAPERTAELQRARQALEDAGPFCLVMRNEFLVCGIVEASFDNVSRALSDALSSSTRYFFARAAQPAEAVGLSRISGFLAARLPGRPG